MVSNLFLQVGSLFDRDVSIQRGKDFENKITTYRLWTSADPNRLCMVSLVFRVQEGYSARFTISRLHNVGK